MKSAASHALLKFLGIALAVVLGGSGLSAAESVMRGAAAVRPASSVSLSVALKDAHRLAALKGDRVVRVSGTSMLPYFGEGSVLVVREAAPEALHAGAVVVYKNRFGELIAHRVEGRTEAGWTVRGANNADRDSTLVTAENLVGAVYATFYSDPSVAVGEFALADAVAAGTPIALAAPAR